jgi:hypothetical protein
MRKRLLSISVALALLAGGCVYGMTIAGYKVFPYQFLKHIYTAIRPKSSWSIGIYTGSSPLRLSDQSTIHNPVLTCRDVTDVEATSVADPFILRDASTYYMFFEVVNKKDRNTDIALAESTDGIRWTYKQVVIDEPFPLSYPYVFKYEDDYYLIPESGKDLAVRLYRATHFPNQWEYVCNLLGGHQFTDPSIIRYKDRWWMFVSSTEACNALNLYYSDKLTGPWTQHPASPVVKGDKHTGRCGGRLVVFDGRLYRFAQDDLPRYGTRVLALEITEISTTSYKETLASDSPIVEASGTGWNACGMHQVDALQLGVDEWLASVDGWCRR